MTYPIRTSGWSWYEDPFGFLTIIIIGPGTPTTVTANIWLYDPYAHIYVGAEQDATPTSWSTVALTWDGFTWRAPLDLTGSPAGTELYGIEVVADGVTVLTRGFNLWSGDEFVVVTTAPTVLAGALVGGTKTVFFDTATYPVVAFHNPDGGVPSSDLDYLNPDTVFWIDWGDGHETLWAGTWGDSPVYHVYQDEGSFTPRLFIGWWSRAAGGNFPTAFSSLMAISLIATFPSVSAIAPNTLTWTQPRTSMSLDAADYTNRNNAVGLWPNEVTKLFGVDFMIAVAKFADLRTANVTPNVDKIQNVTFHYPYTRTRDNSGRSGNAGEASGQVGMEDDLMFRRDRGYISSPIGDPTNAALAEYDAGKYEKGDGPEPLWLKTGTPLENFITQTDFAPFYLNGYLPLSREGIFSSGDSSATGYARQILQKYNTDTGVFTGRIISPALPDDYGVPLIADWALPVAYQVAGDTGVLWTSDVHGSTWLVDWSTGHQRLVAHLDHVLFGNERENSTANFTDPRGNNYELTIDTSQRYWLLNVRDDGGTTWVFRAQPTSTWDAHPGYFATYAISLDSGGAPLGPPIRLGSTVWGGNPTPDDWTEVGGPTFNPWGYVIADPREPYLYVPRNGTFADNRIPQAVIYRVDLRTGTWTRAAWLGHPVRMTGLVDPVTLSPIAPYSYGFGSPYWDFRWIELRWVGIGNLPAGKYQLRRYPPDITAGASATLFKFVPNA